MFRSLVSIVLAFLILASPRSYAGTQKPSSGIRPSRLGVWITVFSPHKVLYGKDNVDSLIGICEGTGITDIFLQIYRADKAYYDSDITYKDSHIKILDESGTDLIPYLLEKASDRNIKVHAWFNMLSLSRNRDANILEEIGPHITTKDQHGRTALVFKKDELDEYYIRENQLFIDPGYPEVRSYLTRIVEEVVHKYPGFAGVHLDYIRYPSVVPFIPGSRFTSHGLSYGYNWPNIKAFKDMTGKDIREAHLTRSEYMEWDRLRRDNVTSLVREVSEKVRLAAPGMEVSCTVWSSVERTYLVTLQDWTRWLDDDLADFIVVMNYTDDTPLFRMNSKAMLLSPFEDKIMVGVGAYLLEEKPDMLKDQLLFLEELSPMGIVIFSYDDIAESVDLQTFLSDRFAK